jgi:hypothetical protein
MASRAGPRARALLAVLVAAVIVPTVASASGDVAPPTVTDLSITPQSVDATTLAKTLTVTLRVRDDLSGFAVAGIRLYEPSGEGYLYAGFSPATRVSGNALDGTYERAVQLPAGSDLGTWTVEAVDVSDADGNSAVVSAAALAAAGMDTGFRHEPAQATPLPPPKPTAVLVGQATVRVSWGTPASAGASPITEFRVRAEPGSASATVPAAARSADVSGLAPAASYVFTVTPVNTFGEGPDSTPSSLVFVPQWDVTAPTSVSISALPSTFTLSSSIAVGWGASDPSGILGYDVQVRGARWANLPGSWTSWQTRAAAQSAVYRGSPGYTYCFRVRAEDRAGNVSAWSSKRCTSVPLTADQLAYTRTFTRYTPLGAYTNTAYWTKTPGARMKRSAIYGQQVALVALTCSDCGMVRVSWNGVPVKTVNLWSATKKRAQVIKVLGFTSPQAGTLTVDVLTSGKYVVIEGVGVYNGA